MPAIIEEISHKLELSKNNKTVSDIEDKNEFVIPTLN